VLLKRERKEKKGTTKVILMTIPLLFPTPLQINTLGVVTVERRQIKNYQVDRNHMVE
jgi:hypothetical protein